MGMVGARQRSRAQRASSADDLLRRPSFVFPSRRIIASGGGSGGSKQRGRGGINVTPQAILVANANCLLCEKIFYNSTMLIRYELFECRLLQQPTGLNTIKLHLNDLI